MVSSTFQATIAAAALTKLPGLMSAPFLRKRGPCVPGLGFALAANHSRRATVSSARSFLTVGGFSVGALSGLPAVGGQTIRKQKLTFEHGPKRR